MLPLIVIGCATTQVEHHDWSSYDGPGKRFLESEEVEIPLLNDPLEPTNRAIGALDHWIKVIAFRPLARDYRVIVPKPLRNGLRNAGKNLLYPGRLVNPSGYTSTDSTSWLRSDSKMQVSVVRVPSTYTWGWILRWKAI